MHAPAHVCLELYRTHKWIRIAWMGRERRHDDDLNRGSFVIVQLLHVKDAGPIWNPKTVKDMWDVETFQTQAGNWDLRPSWRGPIFNRFGGTTPDWDPLLRRPVMSVVCSPQHGLSTQAVFDGSIVTYVKNSMRSAREKLQDVVNARASKGRELDAKMKDLSSEMSDHLWFEAQKTAASGPIIAKKHIDAASIAKLRRHREGRGFSFEKYYQEKLPQSMRQAASKTNLRFE